MTFEEAKKIFLNRGYIEVPGGTYYDADKWREAIIVISKWLEQEPCKEEYDRGYNKGKADILEKVRAEIEALYNTKNYLDGRGITVLDCLNIIDKYSEE